MLKDSPNEMLAGLMLAIMVVLEFPPKLSFSNLHGKKKGSVLTCEAGTNATTKNN